MHPCCACKDPLMCLCLGRPSCLLLHKQVWRMVGLCCAASLPACEFMLAEYFNVYVYPPRDLGDIKQQFESICQKLGLPRCILFMDGAEYTTQSCIHHHLRGPTL